MQSDLGKLFIGGISWDSNEDRLKEYFSGYGEVLEAIIMKDRNTGRARGFGFVVFADPAVAERVIKEKHNIDGRMVEAKKAVPRDDPNTVMSRSSSSIQGSSPGQGRTRKIFVGGLASSVTEADFKNYFMQFGTITDVVVMYDHNTQRPRGFGFITYDSEDAVDTVLLKTFHELNGKMVEVKRAVPKELSPGPSRSPLIASEYNNYSVNRINSFLNGYNNQGFSPSAMGGRFSPIAAGRSGFAAPFGSGYGMGLNFEPGLNPGFGGNASFNNPLSYGRGRMNHPYFSNRFANPIGFDGGNGGSSSFFSSESRTLWDSNGGGLSYGASSVNSGGGYMGSGIGTIGSNLGNNNATNWGSSQLTNHQSGGNLSGYGFNESNNSNNVSYGRTNSAIIGPPSSNMSYEGAFSDLYNGSSVYGGDPTWDSLNPEREGSGSFDYGLGNGGESDVHAKNSPGYVGGGFSVVKRPSNRGGLPG